MLWVQEKSMSWGDRGQMRLNRDSRRWGHPGQRQTQEGKMWTSNCNTHRYRHRASKYGFITQKSHIYTTLTHMHTVHTHSGTDPSKIKVTSNLMPQYTEIYIYVHNDLFTLKEVTLVQTLIHIHKCTCIHTYTQRYKIKTVHILLQITRALTWVNSGHNVPFCLPRSWDNSLHNLDQQEANWTPLTGTQSWMRTQSNAMIYRTLKDCITLNWTGL